MTCLMSEQTQYELAEELGFAHKVNDDWGNITTREAGSLIRAAIEKTEKPNDSRQIAVGDSIPTVFFPFYTYHKSKKVIDKLSN
ncbi:small, acid-soluble spore protein, alpha/beta type [Halocella sp. SP3-1]|uniref:small, acid-soluble spore protein, alpha/beta type n=1 Tax=Halocella sp. SP3-1 TaxID=2382161 RepID=UPI000F75A5C9|nr:small, acid-soluble spore protein, alpha/beta type [Halocella sp. SP3-1]AZO96310.1 small, acid-soluble spore protein, alpha/beta type [Halocella sp. SP3-1]